LLSASVAIRVSRPSVSRQVPCPPVNFIVGGHPENARLHHLFGATTINIERAHQKAAFVLGQLDQHLGSRTWLEFERPTIADVAVFPYVALAPDGRIDLTPYPHVLAWIDRVRQLPGYVPMRGL
jgi:glutathione S-transferase